MNDAFDSVRDQLKQRLNSPIFGSFVLSWICWNHEFLIVIFSSLEVRDRIALAHSLYSSPWVFAAKLIGLPLFSALAYVLLYPWLSRPLLIYWEDQRRRLEDRLTDLEKKRRLTVEESQDLLVRMRASRQEFLDTISRLETENQALTSQLRRVSENAKAVTDTSFEHPVIQQTVVQLEDAEKKFAALTRAKNFAPKDAENVAAVLETMMGFSSTIVRETQIRKRLLVGTDVIARAINLGLQTGILELVREESNDRLLKMTAQGLEFLEFVATRKMCSEAEGR